MSMTEDIASSVVNRRQHVERLEGDHSWIMAGAALVSTQGLSYSGCTSRPLRVGPKTRHFVQSKGRETVWMDGELQVYHMGVRSTVRSSIFEAVEVSQASE
jgi:hypothetical protein